MEYHDPELDKILRKYAERELYLRLRLEDDLLRHEKELRQLRQDRIQEIEDLERSRQIEKTSAVFELRRRH